MKIGDRVQYKSDRIGKYLYGTITNVRAPKCRCKGMGEWLVTFDGFEDFTPIHIPKNNKKLTIAPNIGVEQNLKTHKL